MDRRLLHPDRTRRSRRSLSVRPGLRPGRRVAYLLAEDLLSQVLGAWCVPNTRSIWNPAIGACGQYQRKTNSSRLDRELVRAHAAMGPEQPRLELRDHAVRVPNHILGARQPEALLGARQVRVALRGDTLFAWTASVPGSRDARPRARSTPSSMLRTLKRESVGAVASGITASRLVPIPCPGPRPRPRCARRAADRRAARAARRR